MTLRVLHVLDVLVELGVLDALPLQPFVERVLVELEVGLEQVPVFEGVLGTFHISFGRVPNEGLGVVSEIFSKHI